MPKNNYEKVAIIIVNYNGKKFLKNCLEAIDKQSYKNLNIYLVDNGSVDDSINYIKNYFSKIKIIELKYNSGFAIGNNVGIKESFRDRKVKYIVCLNNDTIVSKFWLEELVKTANKYPEIGAVSSKAYFEDNLIIQNAGLEFYKVLQTNKNGGISLGYGLTDYEAPELCEDKEIFAPGGVAALYKREILEKIIKRDKEIFDEDFFAYVEDLDLGFRIRSLGYKCYLSANAKLIHLHSKTGGIASPFKAYYCERNSILTAIKNLSLNNLLLFPFRNIKLKLSYIYNKNKSINKLKNNIGYRRMFCIYVKANIAILILLPKFLIKRIKIKKNYDY